MRIYVASSWRNKLQPFVVEALRREGHVVYDFRNPTPGDHGFSWKQCATDEQLKSPLRFRDEVLTHPIAKAGFAKDMRALRGASATVLVLPCGRSAHLELGWAAGMGQKTIVLLDNPLSEPELMYLMNTKICLSMNEVIDAVLAECQYCGAKAPADFIFKSGSEWSRYSCVSCTDERGP